MNFYNRVKYIVYLNYDENINLRGSISILFHMFPEAIYFIFLKCYRVLSLKKFTLNLLTLNLKVDIATFLFPQRGGQDR